MIVLFHLPQWTIKLVGVAQWAIDSVCLPEWAIVLVHLLEWTIGFKLESMEMTLGKETNHC